MAKQSISTTSKFALLAFLMLTIAAPTLSTTQLTTETNPEAMTSILQELGKEQLAASYYYLKKMEIKEQLGLEETKLAMVVEQKPLKCEGKGGPCTWAECCPGLICAYVFPIWKFGTCVDL
ncbi:uncharacterized protein LOC110687065 [Chenopodium quinoa]|uniref:uncharacterized protein LOC110687065 n=1 Tax=Chenopodium quinoa TaxID=63459 RepID=UPI000B77D354|nr:uncharacterized protein LOC110687065 [Chenopodium quinoa]